MPGISTASDQSNRGGLGIVVIVFFILSFALSLAAQSLLFQFVSGDTEQISNEQVIAANDLVRPSADLSPENVVALQLDGLADATNLTGMQQCFLFASPSNKLTTGPLSRFTAMLHRPPYSALLNHELALIGKPQVQAESANVVVTVLDRQNEIHVFQFLLSVQHGKDVENCWMTDAVFPLQQIPAKVPLEHSTSAVSSHRFLRVAIDNQNSPTVFARLTSNRGGYG